MSKSQDAYAWIRERIAQQEYPPGYRLVLATIGRELDMSVVPVREAIRQLEAEGLVDFEHNVGARVAMIDDSQYRHSMGALGVLEGTATALAAPHVDAEGIRAAREVNAQLTRALDDFDPLTFTALNQRFHEILLTPCPNPRLVELVRGEWARLARLRSSTFSFVPGRAQQSVREHEEIVRLVESGAPFADIERAARSHHNATLEAYLAHEHPVTIPA